MRSRQRTGRRASSDTPAPSPSSTSAAGRTGAELPVAGNTLGVKTLVAHLQGKPVEKKIDTGVSLITPENMEQQEFHELLYPPVSKYLEP